MVNILHDGFRFNLAPIDDNFQILKYLSAHIKNLAVATLSFLESISWLKSLESFFVNLHIKYLKKRSFFDAYIISKTFGRILDASRCLMESN